MTDHNYSLEDISKQNEGSLTPEELEKVVQAFQAFDKDGNGYIDEQELKSVLEMMGQNPTEEDVLRMMAEVSPEGDHKISMDLFKRIVQEQKKNSSKSEDEDIMQAFIAMGGEPDGKGYISTDKLKQIIKNDFEMTIDIERLIKDIDRDCSGTIEYEEFKSLLTSH